MKQISHPELTSARVLSPLELNGIHFGSTGQVITPADLASATAHKSGKDAIG